MREHTLRLSPRWRLLLGFGLIDAVFIVILERFKKKGDSYAGWQWFYFGASSAMYVNWMVATVIGIAIGASLPEQIQRGLDFPMTAVFAAMLASTLTDWKALATVVGASAIALIAAPLPYNLGLIAAILGGVSIGGLCGQFAKRGVHAEGA